MQLRMGGSMMVMQYANNFIELSRFVNAFMSSERLKMRRFQDDLPFCICN